MPTAALLKKHRARVHLEIVIRRCRRSDLRQLEWYGMFTCHRAIFEEAYARSRRSEVVMLVADLGGFPVGQVWIDLAKTPGAGMLWALRVYPFLNGMGIGKRLVQAAEDVLRRRGIPAVELGVEKGAAAVGFYQRLGYTITGEAVEHVDYTDPQGDAHRMTHDMYTMRKDLIATTPAC